MPKQKTPKYICNNCGYEAHKWMGMCLQCKMYNTFEEQKTPAAAGIYPIVTLAEADSLNAEERIPTNITELDRVLNGGIVCGCVILIGGEPGIGKSTLLLQICQSVAVSKTSVLYISGEESITQIKMRAKRLNVTSEHIRIAAETDFKMIKAMINDTAPDIVLIDSIQTICDPVIPSAAGSVTQVRECAQGLIRMAKLSGAAVVLVGHVTKDGQIAGPKILEHMVDTVLYFEGEHHASYRIIRSVKNRFGPANEIGVFEMRENGLIEILNPSEYMLAGRPEKSAGSAVTAIIEGSRPILIEVQALVSYTNFATPRRTTNGIDYNRSVMLLAVLEKRQGFKLSSYDSYINIAGGLKAAEPSVDLAVVAAVASSYTNINVSSKTMIFGEVGLTGEVRAVTKAGLRVKEAAKFGFTECIMPRVSMQENAAPEGMRVLGVANIAEMTQLLF